MAELPTFLIDGQDVPMDRLRGFLTRLSGQAAAALLNTVDGAKPFATLAAAQAAPAVAAGTQARVFNDPVAANNGLYVNRAGAVGGYVLDAVFYDGVANVLNPLVAQARDASDAAAAAAAAISGVPVGLPVNGNANEINSAATPPPPVDSNFEILIASTNTGEAFLTAGGVRLRVVNGGGVSIPAGGLEAGRIAMFNRSPGGGYVLMRTRPSGAEATPSASDDAALAKTPWGTVSFGGGGTRTVTPIERFLLVCGSSNAHPDYVPAAQLPAKVAADALNEFLPGNGVVILPETRAQPGAPLSTLGGQLDAAASYQSGSAKWAFVIYGMNDARTLFYHSQGGVPAQMAALEAGIRKMRIAGVEPVLCTIFPPDPRASDVALDPNWFANAAAFPGGGSTQNMDYPAFKPAPVDPVSQMTPTAEQALTEPRAWTSTGIKRVGYRRIWDVNRRIRRLAARLDCVLLDFHASAYRNAIELVADQGDGLDAYYNKLDPLHPKPKLYDDAVTPVIREWALAVAQGRTDQRVFSANPNAVASGGGGGGGGGGGQPVPGMMDGSGIRFTEEPGLGIRREDVGAISIVVDNVPRLIVRQVKVTFNVPDLEVSSGTRAQINYYTAIANWSAGVPEGGNRWRVTENQFGSEHLTVLANGNIGFGVVAPTSKGHFSGGNATQVTIENTGGGGDNAVAYRVPGKQWNVGINVGGTGAGTFNFYDVSRGTPVMSLDNAGNLLVGVSAASSHTIARGGAEGDQILNVSGLQHGSGYFYSGANGQVNGAAATLRMFANATTGRSINTAGTINASGADYAEYMTKAPGCGIVQKGDVCGVDRQGQITGTWADAIMFKIKSTDPNLVGGDTWAAHLGAPPVQPSLVLPQYDGPEEPAEPADNAAADDYARDREAYDAAQTAHAGQVAAAEEAHEVALFEYATNLATFEADLEAARQTVDRIAYCGRVPVNFAGTCEPGDYLVAVANGGGIGLKAVAEADITFADYRRRVGRVLSIGDDDRPIVDVTQG